MIGFINESTTRGVLWLRDEIEQAIVTVKPEGVQGYVSMNLLRAQTKLKPEIKNGKWKITVQAETEDDIIQNATKLRLMDPKVTQMLEQQLKKDINQKIELALNQVQKEMKADIFGFADAFHRAYPAIWKKHKNHWDEIFPNVEVTVKITSKIRRPGMISQPGAIPNDEVKKK
jgi:spore germination protein KC